MPSESSSTHPLQRLDRAPLSKRLSELTGGRPVKAPMDLTKAVALLQPIPPAPAWRGVVLALIDVSGSMSGEPLAQAKRGIVDFARDAIEKRYDVGLIAFGNEANEVAAPIREIRAIARAAERLSAEGGTDMSGAILLATERLKG